MIFKNVKLAAILTLFLSGMSNAFALDEGSETARQVVEKFQTDLIAVMKDGKKLGYAGRYEKLKDPISNSHELTKIARIVVGKEWENLSEKQHRL